MSDSIATLGIRITSDAAKATADLNQLGAAAKTAAGASTNLTASTKTQSAAHAGLSSQAQAAGHSIRSLVEAMASGAPISQALGQQLGHLSYAASGSSGLTGAFKQATGALLGLLSPTTLIIGGIAAVGAGFAYAIHNIALTGKAFDDTAHSANTTTDALHGLANAAAAKGIGNDDFLKAMDRFGASVYEAQNRMGPLAELMRANGQSASTFADYMGRTADLIKNAASDAQRLKILQEAGLPATMDWVRFMSQGADGIKRATDEAVKFNASAEGQLVAAARKFDEAWNTTWNNWSNNIKNALMKLDEFSLSAISKFSALAQNTYGSPKSNPGQGLIPGAQGFTGNTVYTPNTYGTGAAPKTSAELQKEISDRQTLIGLYGQTASVAQVMEQIQNQADATYLSTGVRVSQSKIDQLKELAAQQTLGITAIRASTDAQNTEAQTVGMSTGQAAAYAAAQNAINDAKRAGRTLTPQNIADITAEANALGAAAQNADNLKWSYTNLVNGPLQAFSSALQQGSNAFDALKKAGQSALNSIASKLMDMASQNLWKAAFGGSSGGGGIFSSLFGMGSGSTAVMSSGLGAGTGGLSFPMFASGTPSAPGGWSVVGEHGPELMNVPKGAQILPNGTAPGGGPTVIIQQYNTFTGNDPGTEARMRQAIVQSKDAAVQAAVQAVANIKGTSPGYLRAAR